MPQYLFFNLSFLTLIETHGYVSSNTLISVLDSRFPNNTTDNDIILLYFYQLSSKWPSTHALMRLIIGFNKTSEILTCYELFIDNGEIGLNNSRIKHK